MRFRHRMDLRLLTFFDTRQNHSVASFVMTSFNVPVFTPSGLSYRRVRKHDQDKVGQVLSVHLKYIGQYEIHQALDQAICPYRAT